jgi:hypothetical protein
MRSAGFLIAASLYLLVGLASASAQEASIVGTWAATDPATGREEQLVITAQHLQFSPDQPPLPYEVSQTGNVFILKVGGDEIPPLRINLLNDEEATLTLPGSETIALTRVAAPAAPDSAAAATTPAPPQNALDEALTAFVPFGVKTRFEPLNQSLEQLLADGWSLDQAGGASGGFTLLMSKGDTRALCMLIPHSLGQAATALSDCRRLN